MLNRRYQMEIMLQVSQGGHEDVQPPCPRLQADRCANDACDFAAFSHYVVVRRMRWAWPRFSQFLVVVRQLRDFIKGVPFEKRLFLVLVRLWEGVQRQAQADRRVARNQKECLAA